MTGCDRASGTEEGGAGEQQRDAGTFRVVPTSRAPTTEPIAMIDESSPNSPAPLWNTLTDIVEMKIGKVEAERSDEEDHHQDHHDVGAPAHVAEAFDESAPLLRGSLRAVELLDPQET